MQKNADDSDIVTEVWPHMLDVEGFFVSCFYKAPGISKANVDLVEGSDIGSLRRPGCDEHNLNKMKLESYL